MEASPKNQDDRFQIGQIFPTRGEISFKRSAYKMFPFNRQYIAEGHGRFHYQDNIRFCIIARGSLSETLDHIIVAKDEEMITEQIFNSFQSEYDQCLKLLNGYIQFVKRKKNNELE